VGSGSEGMTRDMDRPGAAGEYANDLAARRARRRRIELEVARSEALRLQSVETTIVRAALLLEQLREPQPDNVVSDTCETMGIFQLARNAMGSSARS
jgi:hypothetical protein